MLNCVYDGIALSNLRRSRIAVYICVPHAVVTALRGVLISGSSKRNILWELAWSYKCQAAVRKVQLRQNVFHFVPCVAGVLDCMHFIVMSALLLWGGCTLRFSDQCWLTEPRNLKTTMAVAFCFCVTCFFWSKCCCKNVFYSGCNIITFTINSP
jgi:hypothetical protein